MAINQQMMGRIKSHSLDELLKEGDLGCSIPGNNEDESNNMDQMFFKFRAHYFTPIIMSHGGIVYYAFENETTIEDWITKAANEHIDYVIAVNSPIYYDNALGIYITKKAELRKPKANPY